MSVTLAGVAASSGIALAAPFLPHSDLHASAASDLKADPSAVTEAFAAVGGELSALAATLRAKGLADEADILEAESLIASDEELASEVLAAMAKGADAGDAIATVGAEFASLLESLESEYLQERAADVRQVVRRVLSLLSGPGETAALPEQFILCDADVGPADLLERAGDGLAGAVSLRGGVNAHAAIVARSLGVPLLLGIDPRQLEFAAGVDVLLDADRSVLVIDPPADVRKDARRRIRAGTDTRRRYAVERDQPAETVDGRPVVLLCNVASAAELQIAFDAGAAGVGLLRTELPFLDSTGWPTEEEHREFLETIFASLDDVPVTVRLLDFSNDKVPPFLIGRPAGLEALLAAPAALQAQLAAVLEVGRRARTTIMLPMVRTPEEVLAVRAQLRGLARQVRLPEPPLGVMVELPEAVERSDELAAVADFFSIGTNDLTSTVLGLDRSDQGSRPGLTAHPKVLSQVVRTCQAAKRAGIPVSVCGDAAGDPLVLPLLLGASVSTLSVSPARVDEVRWRIRRTNASEWETHLGKVLQLRDAEAALAYLDHVEQDR